MFDNILSWVFGRYSSHGARAHGRADGKRQYPKSEPSCWCQGAGEAGRRQLEQQARRYIDRDDALVAEELSARKATKNADNELLRLQGLGCEKQPAMSGPLYWLVLAILIILEFPLTRRFLENIGFGATETILASLGIAAIYIGLAHMFGVAYKRLRTEPGAERSARVLMFGTAGFALIGTLAMTMIRWQVKPDLGSAVGLAFVQFGGFVVAAYCSYCHHDPKRSWEAKKEAAVLREKKANRRRLDLYDKALSRAQEQLAELRQLSFEYQHANLSKRTDLQKLPAVTEASLPESLKNLRQLPSEESPRPAPSPVLTAPTTSTNHKVFTS